MANGPRNSNTGGNQNSSADTDIDLTKSILEQLGEDENDNEEDTGPGGGQDLDDDESDSEYEEADEPEEEDEDEGDETRGHEEGTTRREESAPKRLRADAKGNLIDPKTGKVIAPAGPARRFYEQAASFKLKLGQADGEIGRLNSVVNQAKEIITQQNAAILQFKGQQDHINKLGLSPQDVAEFTSLAAKFNDNATALDAIRYLLTKAVQRGIDIKPLGAGSAAFDPSVFARSITDQVSQAIKPLTDREVSREHESRLLNEVRSEISQFQVNYPEARQYLPVLGKILENPRFSHLSLEGAWDKLRLHLMRRQMNGGGGRGNSQHQRQQPRPSGRPTPGARGGQRFDETPASVDQSFKEILKGVINDVGEIE